MPIFYCDLCPLAFATQGELTSHQYMHFIPSAPASYQPNQAAPFLGLVRELEVTQVKALEGYTAAHTFCGISQGRICMVDYGQPQHRQLETCDGPRNAKRLHGVPKTIVLETEATRRPMYQCDECPAEFPSYQALGGHKSGHKKAAARSRSSVARVNQVPPQPQMPPEQKPLEAPPPPPLSPQQQNIFLNLNEPPLED